MARSGKKAPLLRCYLGGMELAVTKRILLVAGTVGVALSGCAQTTVQVERDTATAGRRPAIVLVRRFAVTASEVTANQGILQSIRDAADGTSVGARDAAIAAEVSERVADDLVARIGALGLPARRAGTQEPVPADAVVVAGYFQDINEGNRTQRLVIGLGAGQATLDMQVILLRAGSTLLAFETHSDSGEMPGAAITMGAGAAAQGGATVGMAAANVAATGIKGYRSSTDAMAGRSAEKAARTLAQYFAGAGWIPPDRVPQSPFGASWVGG